MEDRKSKNRVAARGIDPRQFLVYAICHRSENHKMALNFKANFSLQTGAVLVNLGGPCQVFGQIEMKSDIQRE